MCHTFEAEIQATPVLHCADIIFTLSQFLFNCFFLNLVLVEPGPQKRTIANLLKNVFTGCMNILSLNQQSESNDENSKYNNNLGKLRVEPHTFLIC